jgi:type III secretory pathway lipoprotein EscJ
MLNVESSDFSEALEIIYQPKMCDKCKRPQPSSTATYIKYAAHIVSQTMH